MIEEIISNVAANIATTGLYASAKRYCPFARPYADAAWRWFRGGLASDYRRFCAMSRRRKASALTVNVYVLGALIAANICGADAPIAIQVWGASVMLILIGGCGWLAVRGVCRVARRTIA